MNNNIFLVDNNNNNSCKYNCNGTKSDWNSINLFNGWNSISGDWQGNSERTFHGTTRNMTIH